MLCVCVLARACESVQRLSQVTLEYEMLRVQHEKDEQVGLGKILRVCLCMLTILGTFLGA